jgi:hypothetical protein
MNDFILRWREVGIVALALFAINVAGRFVAEKMIKSENQQVLEDRQSLAGFITLGTIFLVFFGLTLYWGRKRTMWRVGTELGFAGAIACVLAVLVGPLIIGQSPFKGGAGDFFAQIWWWIGMAVAGVFLGYVVLISFAADYKARQLKAYVDRAKAQPRRV